MNELLDRFTTLGMLFSFISTGPGCQWHQKLCHTSVDLAVQNHWWLAGDIRLPEAQPVMSQCLPHDSQAASHSPHDGDALPQSYGSLDNSGDVKCTSVGAGDGR